MVARVGGFPNVEHESAGTLEGQIVLACGDLLQRGDSLGPGIVRDRLKRGSVRKNIIGFG